MYKKSLITLLSALTIATFVVHTPQAEALSCIAPEPTASFIAQGGVVFIGTATSNISTGTVVESGTSFETRRVTFAISEAWSTSRITTPFTVTDRVPPQDPLTGSEDIWGFRKTFNVGTKYVVYASMINGEYRADIGGCDRSHEYTNTARTQLVNDLGASYTPTTTTTSPPTTTNPFTAGLITQIQSLLELVAKLQHQLANLGGGGSTPVVVVDFKSCVAAGNPVMESYPRQCSHNGQNFVEVIGNPINPTFPVCPNLSRTVGQGARGNDVVALQQFLAATGDYTHPTATGYFGIVTEQAVKRFQAKFGVVASGAPSTTGYGLVGPATRSVILQQCGGSTTQPEEPRFCTQQYDPVCGRKNGEIKTYGNSCTLAAEKAQFLYAGECRADTTPEAPYSCRIWNDGCNSCSRAYPGGPLMCTLRACIWQGIPKCEAYFDDSNVNTVPVIHSFSGPTVLRVNQQGTWTVQASDPQNGPLSYRVDWGDSQFPRPLDAASASAPFAQTSTLTHTYARAGTYTVVIVVRDAQGLEAKTSTTVRVDSSASVSESFVVTQQPGSPTLTATATITLAERDSNVFEICGPITVGTIYWGDGTTSNATRLGCSSQRIVIMHHTYAYSGTYNVVFERSDGARYTQSISVR